MAAVPDITAVPALVKKSLDLDAKGHEARHTEYTQRALEAAQARSQDDCLVVAALQHTQAANLFNAVRPQLLQFKEAPLSAQHVCPLPAFEGVVPLLLAAVKTLQRRRAAGTLLPGCCRADEVLYAELFNVYTANAPEGAAQFIGYLLFLDIASLALHLLPLMNIHVLVVTQEQLRLCITFIADAIELYMLPRQFEGVYIMSSEGAFIAVLGALAFSPTDLDWLGFGAEGVRLLDNLERLQQSGVLQRRSLGCSIQLHQRLATAHVEAYTAVASAPGLRSCALNTCDAREQHPSHFKCCAACKAVVYCSREHQVQDWPSHKAACKAACKAAAAEAKKK